ncbi:MAG: sortase [bacterium]
MKNYNLKQNLILKNKAVRTVTLIIIVFFLLYLVYAYYPLLKYKFRGEDLTKETINTPIEEFISEKKEDKKIPEKNSLIIPKIGVYAEILEGDSLSVLDKQEGVWREPQTSIPTRGSNMVIAGHRRQFLPPNINTFYLLPELKEGDFIIMYWEKEKYVYKITKTSDTHRKDQFAYEKTPNSVITLYTCIPLESANSRFVVRAERIN